jgi:hypothetical protein
MILKALVLISSSEDVVAGEMFSVGKFREKLELLYRLNGDGELFWEWRDEGEDCGGGLILWGYMLGEPLGKWAWGGLFWVEMSVTIMLKNPFLHLRIHP